MATANEPSPALTWLSSVDLLIRANRVPITAPMPTSATLRIQGGRPPSISPVPCSTAGGDHRAEHPARRKFHQPQQQRRGDRGRGQRRRVRAARRSGWPRAGGADDAMPVSASSSGSAAVRMITRMVCTTAIAGDIGALLGGEHGDLRQRAGAAGQQRRGLVPAVEALQIEAAAEGRAERRQRQQARWSGDRRSYAGSSAATPASPAMIPSSTSTVWVRIGGMPSGRPASAAMPTAIIAPEISPPGRLSQQKQRAAGGADRERLERR